MAEINYSVTYLEMTEKPKGPPPPRPDEAIVLMKAPQPPVHFFRYLFDAVGGDYHWMEFRDWPSEKLSRFIRNPAVDLTVLYRDGVPIGMYQLDRRVPGVCDLAYLGLTPEARGRRIGHWLFWVAIEEAWTPTQSGAPCRPVEKVTHKHCTLDHPSAEEMFEQAGFRPVRREERLQTVPAGMGFAPNLGDADRR